MPDGDAEFGNTLINYRYQSMLEGPGRPAFSPRVSLILPTGNSDELDSTGLQFNLPFSKQTGDVYWHWNAGMTWQPAVRRMAATRTSSRRSSPAAPSCACTPMLQRDAGNGAASSTSCRLVGTVREESFTLSPGVRGGWNFGDQQLILGLAVPITWTGDEDADTAAFFYVSYELPFKKQ